MLRKLTKKSDGQNKTYNLLIENNLKTLDEIEKSQVKFTQKDIEQFVGVTVNLVLKLNNQLKKYPKKNQVPENKTKEIANRLLALKSIKNYLISGPKRKLLKDALHTLKGPPPLEPASPTHPTVEATFPSDEHTVDAQPPVLEPASPIHPTVEATFPSDEHTVDAQPPVLEPASPTHSDTRDNFFPPNLTLRAEDFRKPLSPPTHRRNGRLKNTEKKADMGSFAMMSQFFQSISYAAFTSFQVRRERSRTKEKTKNEEKQVLKYEKLAQEGSDLINFHKEYTSYKNQLLSRTSFEYKEKQLKKFNKLDEIETKLNLISNTFNLELQSFQSRPLKLLDILWKTKKIRDELQMKDREIKEIPELQKEDKKAKLKISLYFNSVFKDIINHIQKQREYLAEIDSPVPTYVSIDHLYSQLGLESKKELTYFKKLEQCREEILNRAYLVEAKYATLCKENPKDIDNQLTQDAAHSALKFCKAMCDGLMFKNIFNEENHGTNFSQCTTGEINKIIGRTPLKEEKVVASPTKISSSSLEHNPLIQPTSISHVSPSLVGTLSPDASQTVLTEEDHERAEMRYVI